LQSKYFKKQKPNIDRDQGVAHIIIAVIEIGPLQRFNKHSMTDPKGNSEFCFSETLSVLQGEAEGNVEVEGKQNSPFPAGPVIKCFVIPPNSKIETNCEEIVCLTRLAHKFAAVSKSKT